MLSAPAWPGNLDELRAVLDRVLRAAPAGPVRQEDVLAHLPIDGGCARIAPQVSLREARRQFEREYIASVLERHRWRMSEAARTLGIERANLYRKTRQLGILRRTGAPSLHDMRPLRILLAACLPCCVVPSTAAPSRVGQTPVPPGTITSARCELTPSLVLKDEGVDTTSSTSRSTRSTTSPFDLTPRGDVALRMRRLRLGVRGRRPTTSTTGSTNRARPQHFGPARVDLDLGALKPYASVEGPTAARAPNPEVDARARHRDLSMAPASAVKIASRTTLIVNGTAEQLAVRRRPTISRRRSQRELRRPPRTSRRRRRVRLDAVHQFSPCSWHASSSASTSRPARDSNSWRVSPTFTFSPTGLLTGSATLRLPPLYDALADAARLFGLVSAVNVGATIYRRNQMQARSSTATSSTRTTTATPYYLNTGGTLTWTYLLAGPIDMRGTGGRTAWTTRSPARRSAGDDHITTYGGGIGYRFTNRARLGVNAEWHAPRLEPGGRPDYRNHRIFAGLTWGTTL